MRSLGEPRPRIASVTYVQGDGASVHQQPAALISAADIWKAASTSSSDSSRIVGAW